MRVSAWKDFWKLHRILDNGLDAGSYEMLITLRYPVASFAGTKGFVLTNANVFGGGNSSLAYIFLALGAFHVFLIVAFGSLALFGPEPKKPTVKFTEGLIPPAALKSSDGGLFARFVMPQVAEESGGANGSGEARQVQFPPEEGGNSEGQYASNFVSTTKY